MIKKWCCTSAAYFILRDPSKPKKSCTQICCHNYLKSRLRLLRFKISWDYFTLTEEKTSKKLFFILAFSLFIYFMIGIALPFIAAVLGPDECSSVSPMYVYAAYGAFMVFSALIEMSVFIILKKSLKVDGISMMPCNRYVFGKFLQGQLANLVYFLHFCYVAQALICLNSKEGANQLEHELSHLNVDLKLGQGIQSALLGVDLTPSESAMQQSQEILKIVSSVLAIIAAPILFMSNIRRVIYTI